MATRRRDGRQTYGSRHRNLKKRLLADLARLPGQPCARCGWPMTVEMDLHLDHAGDGSYLGLSHAVCNLRAGQQITTAILRARRGQFPPGPRQAPREAAETATWASARRW